MKKFLIILSVFVFSLLPFTAKAAELYLILDKTEVAEKESLSGTVYVQTGGLPINNAESTIHFPSDLIGVDSVTSSGSIFNIWVEQPSFSNSEGTVYFNGGLPTPGYTGQSGNILRINFRAKKSGVANLSFGSSAVRANDGKGTDVLSQTKGASVNIVKLSPVKTEETQTPAPSASGLPKAPVITSDDMPDQNAWYNKSEGSFYWDTPADSKAVSLVLSKSPNTTPSVIYDPPIKNKKLTELTEGTQYLNARFKNATGWGKIGTRKIQIDLTPPENLVIKTSETEEGLVSIEATAEDAISGVGKYVAYINDKKVAEARAEQGKFTHFNLEPIQTGDYELTVRVYDRAENYAETGTVVKAPEIKAPKITHYPESVKVGSKIEIRGKSPSSDSKVVLWLEEDGKNAESHVLIPDEDKIFSFTSDPVEKTGVASIWAETQIGNVKSPSSEKIRISVKQSDFLQFSIKAIQGVSIIIALVLLLILLALLLYFALRKANSLRRRLRRSFISTEQEIHKVFKLLKEDMKRHQKMLEKASVKRKLTKEESKIFAELSENIDELEGYLETKIKTEEENS